jgi:ABC-type phosphate transport system substrate-binding protein
LRSTTTLIAGAAALAASAALVLGADPALADPPSGVTPAHTDIVGVGAQTDDQLFNQLSTDYNAAFATGPRLYSYDAVGTPTIPEKTGCAVNGVDPTRPNGANAGISALEANQHPSGDTTDYCVDFARDTRVRSSTDPSSIVFIPLAIDSVTWTADNQPGHKTHAVKTLTPIQLRAIYSCDASILGNGGTGPVTWNEVGGTSHNAVVPVIPNSLSGTRTIFLSAIGVTTLGSCVLGQDNSVEQNEGVNPIFTGSNSADIIFPYSVAVFLGQTEHNIGAGQQGSQVLEKVNGISPTKGSGTSKTLNPNFPFVRFVFNVIRNGSTSGAPTVPAYLQKVFGNGTAGSGWLCKAAAKTDIKNYGFLTTTQCGTLQ